MKVLQISGAYSGAQKTIEHVIHSRLLEGGHESLVLYAIGEPDSQGVVCYETSIERFFRRAVWKFSKHAFSPNRISTLRLIRKIKRFSPDIVHLHTIHNGYLNFHMLFRFLAKMKYTVVYSLHDMWPITGGCYYYTASNCEGFLSECKNCTNTQNMDCWPCFAQAMLQKKKNAFSKCKRIGFVAVSEWVRSEAKKTYLTDYPLYTVWNGMKCRTAPKLKCKSNQAPFQIIGVAASWGERKGIKRFFELARELGDEYEIVLVGAATDEIIESAPKNIRFVGSISNKDELYRMYENADLHVSLSLEETFGMTFVEAAFSGIRSVAFDSTAMTYVIPMVRGFLVEPSVSAASQMIRSLKEDRERCFLTDEEIKDIQAVFSEDNMFNGYFKVYCDLLEN